MLVVGLVYDFSPGQVQLSVSMEPDVRNQFSSRQGQISPNPRKEHGRLPVP